jgi:nicotinamidase-related amidase
MKQALLVIDAQESFRYRPYFRAEGLAPFLTNLQSLIERCAVQDIPVVQVFHRELPDEPGNPFAAASGHVRALVGLTLQPTVVVYKQVHSALYAQGSDGLSLEAWLRQRGIRRLLITGIRTEQCCETSARHASDAGFEVLYVSDATLTFPMRTRAGREVSAAELRERTELVLEGRFAQIVTSSAALA